jgi:hypothetical protein
MIRFNSAVALAAVSLSLVLGGCTEDKKPEPPKPEEKKPEDKKPEDKKPEPPPAATAGSHPECEGLHAGEQGQHRRHPQVVRQGEGRRHRDDR